MTLKDDVKRYQNEGWSPIPIPAGEKGPRATGWEEATFPLVAFEDGMNVGVHLGKPMENGDVLYDVDLDAKEAAIAADMLLPLTNRVSGRAGKPRSHRFFTAAKGLPIITHVSYLGIGGANDTIVELRGRSPNGSPTQTVIPLSVHPSGEPVEWDQDGKPFHCTTQEQLDAWTTGVRNIGLAVLFARAFPGPNSGNGHALRCALAGFLFRAGVDPADIKAIGKVVMKLTNGNLADWTDACGSTIAKLQQDPNAQVTGGPRLMELMKDGQLVIKRANNMLGRVEVAELEEFDERHFFVRLGKDSVIGREDDEDVVFQRPQALSIEYANRLVTFTDKKGKETKRPIFEVWLKWPRRRSFRKVVFAPPPVKASKDDFNLWRDFAVEAKLAPDAATALGCARILWHIRNVICCDEPEHYEYLMNLIAYMVQHPGEQLGIAIIMRGKEGTGKGIFVEILGALFGPAHYVHLTRMDQAIGRFNKSILGKIVIFLDEAAADAARKNAGTLKSFVTDPTVEIELKGIDTTSVANQSHVFIATNEKIAVPLDNPEEAKRRYFFLHVSDAYADGHCPAPRRKMYFDPLFAALKDKAVLGALLYNLQHRDLTGFDRFDKPITDEEREQRLMSMRGPLQWLFEIVETGLPTGWPDDEVIVDAIYGHYQQWSRDHLQEPTVQTAWGKVMQKYLWAEKTRATRDNGVGVRKVKFVSQEQLRKNLPPLANFQVEEYVEIWKTPNGYEERRVVEKLDDAEVTDDSGEDLPF